MDQKISIIVPVYNMEKKLERCVASLQRQTYPNVEIILVNDGSKDGSLRLCQELAEKDPSITVIDKVNGGVSSARNTGIEAANGAFVMFCDSDDWVEPDWCSCLYEHYVPGQLTVCQFQWEDAPKQEHAVEAETVEKVRYMHNSGLMCSPINKIFSRAVLMENNIRFPREISLGEDLVFCLRYLCAISGPVRYVYRELYHYDTSDADTLSSKAPALSQCEKFYQAVTEAMKSLEIKDAQSIFIRDTFVASHFERYLKAVARKDGISIAKKLKEAEKVGNMEGFRNTCAQGIRWGNPVYLWLMQHGCVRMGMLYMLLVLKIKKRI